MYTCLQDYSLIGIMDMWWDGSYEWNGEMEGCSILEKTGREDRRKRSVALYVNDQLEYTELCWGMDKKLTRSLWVRIKGMTGSDSGDLPQAMQLGNPSDEVLYRHVGVAPCSQTLGLMGDFKHPDIYWRDIAIQESPGMHW